MVKPDLSCRCQAPPLRGMWICPNPRTKNENLAPGLWQLVRLRVIAAFLQPRSGCEAWRLACDNQARYYIAAPQDEPQDAKRQPPHLIALSTASISVARANATARSASSA
eukprot:1186565-Pleurochrysis_carterae.AAC.1